ncbi:MAG: N-6 DNA methylase [Desulfobacterales bacterium]|uniref:site-specific DNA-methyltransferase (adenine-specific) n=1 Tax=Candidatus Desulfatibia profunda TaxID=2841695 RepID=A0A8J6NWB9_9BACT|nr:N-6 DNA methylase [Candidatus Desulfatibia profunda]MBL7179878.1 N-6 DNA methylase [Desulfobacterales bacterium]
MDIDTVNTHTGHLKILQNLAIPTSGKKAVTTFEGLYNYWQEVFSVALLSKRFYQDLSSWYFWALKHVEFPDDAEKDRDVRNATSVIRLITRLMFVWFLKEKKLVPDALFDKDELDEHLDYKDSHDSTYYKAILQNLFFATLNTKMKKDDPESRKFVNRQYGIQEFYRYERFFKDKNKALKLFETIPFLNGGLFENLDKNIAQTNEVRIDCFSNRPVYEKRLKVPDFLFFGAADQIDLSDVYGSQKRKNETVRGIIHILNSYKFTIAENTPIEEEIALDPELLGKVFENLLASYNPETKTTARKQTGSFYTPREIVNYMVDESLIAYLEGKLIALYEKESGLTTETPPSQKSMFGKQKPVQSKIVPTKPKITAKVKKEINDKLRHLLSYSTEDHQFSKHEVKTIIDVLDNAKILDPACGSGAFPMGMLHKMVHILTKLDPQNKQWKQRQIENQTRQIKQDISYAEKIKDDKARQKAMDELEERMATINDAFDTNELDFGRKLYLIENCIFGVDIQPIAVQIAKLRFFISLIVDQLTDENKENLGIIPLPNLETKFVAANTLIGIDKKGQIGLNFQNSEINKKEKELAKVRERHFSARTPNTKEKYRQKDENLRNEIAELLKKDGFASEVTQKLAHWNPYDQNTFADFFDMDWMFGVKDGFDIVIGNPPYGVKFSSEEKKLYNSLFRHQDYQLDSYLLFLEKGVQLVRAGAGITYIIPNPWLTNLKLKKIRKYISNEVTVSGITHYMRKVFDAVVDTEVVLLKKSIPNNNIVNIIIYQDKDKFDSRSIPQHKWQVLNGEPINIFIDEKTEKLIDIIKNNTILLRNICNITVGMKPYQNGKGKPKQTKNVVKNRVFDATYKKGKSYRPLLRGRDIEKFVVKWEGNRWINYGDWLAEPRYTANFDAKEKIVIRQTGDSLIATLDIDQFVCMNNMHVIHSKSNEFNLKYILGLINSNLLNFYYQSLNPEKGEALAEVKKENVEKLVIKNASETKKKGIIGLVDKVLTTKKSNPSADTTALEAEIDARVAHLYNLTEEEYALVLKETNCPDPFRVAALNVYRDIDKGKIK